MDDDFYSSYLTVDNGVGSPCGKRPYLYLSLGVLGKLYIVFLLSGWVFGGRCDHDSRSEGSNQVKEQI